MRPILRRQPDAQVFCFAYCIITPAEHAEISNHRPILKLLDEFHFAHQKLTLGAIAKNSLYLRVISFHASFSMGRYDGDMPPR